MTNCWGFPHFLPYGRSSENEASTGFAPKAQTVLGISLMNAHKMQLAAVLLSSVGMSRDARAACCFG